MAGAGAGREIWVDMESSMRTKLAVMRERRSEKWGGGGGVGEGDRDGQRKTEGERPEKREREGVVVLRNT